MNEIKMTGDGSTTLYVPGLNEHYHSVFGAVTESKHVFIQNGMHKLHKNPVIIFEVGFGTGLNALLACLDAQEHKRAVIYYAIEKYPVEDSLIAALNYAKYTATKDTDINIFTLIHRAEWGSKTAITPYFSLYKMKGDLTYYKPGIRYDLIFFDAFAPDKQPEMWTKEIVENLYDSLCTGGILVTYCAKGQIKRLLRQTGFQVEILAGPPGKRHMIRATKAGER